MRVPVLVVAIGVLVPALPAQGQSTAPTVDGGMPFIRANDNRRAAGRLEHSTLTLRLVAQAAQWKPEGEQGRTLSVQAFGEEGGAPAVPGPLVRVPAGTEIHVTVRNAIAGATLTVHGLQQRPAFADTALTVPAGETRELRFMAGAPGTYHYWASTSGRAIAARRDMDSALGGAFVVDPPGAVVRDRIFVFNLWRDPASQQFVEVGTINGHAWPFSEKLDHRVGDRVRWRVINLSFDQHALHLHGFHFKVLAGGDGLVDRQLSAHEQPVVVTEHVTPGETFEMEWMPARPGNWLFHCHMVGHMTPSGAVPAGHHAETDEAGGMAGLVLGIRVTGDTPREPAHREPRRFSLLMREEPGRYATHSGFRFDVEGLDAPRLTADPVPGPVIVLTRGEPVEVTIVNRMTEPSAVHWHGIELDSYFDGVPGWGGSGGSVTPAVAPGGSFVARFTPPRAGTYIYHTHWHDEAQLGGGLYGALIVLDPGERYDPTTDHVLIIGFNGIQEADQREPFALNGQRAFLSTRPLRLRAAVPNRLRLINITPNNVALTFTLTDGFEPVTWKAVAKDGADLPAALAIERKARQLVSVGETYDFQMQPSLDQRLWIEVRRGNGEWVAEARVIVER